MTPIARAAKPRVLLNLVRLLPGERGAGGAGRVVLALLAHLPRSVDLRVAIPGHWRGLIARFPEAGFEVVDDDSNASLRRLLDWCECYIDPLNGLRPALIDPRVAVIAFVLDLQHLRMPWLFAPEVVAGRITEYGYAIDRSDWLVAISAYERDNFVAFYGIDRVTVMHLAGFMAEDSGLDAKAVRARRVAVGDEGSYLVYPAVPWAHKNHDTLIQAVALLKRRGLRVRLALTNVAGQPAERERLGRLGARLDVSDLVDLHEFLDEAALLDLVLASRGMVFPSLYEGFGIPLVDAMALGVPVLAAPVAAVPEICGEAAAYATNASNALALADDVAAFWSDAGRRRELAERGLARARGFSSEAMVASLVGAVDAALAAKAARALPPPSRLERPVHYRELAVFVAYADLSAEERAGLRAIGNIAAWHARAFGADADVTVGLDVALADDPEMRALFAASPKLICFDGRDPAAFDAAVVDYSRRLDHAEFQLVTAYRDGGLRAYGADAVRGAVMALRLHASADCASPDPRVQNCVLHGPPDEREGVLDYHRHRTAGLAVRDTLLRRASAHGRWNGTVAFLSDFCTRYARLDVPIVREGARAATHRQEDGRGGGRGIDG